MLRQAEIVLENPGEKPLKIQKARRGRAGFVGLTRKGEQRRGPCSFFSGSDFFPQYGCIMSIFLAIFNMMEGAVEPKTFRCSQSRGLLSGKKKTDL
jgi:hypothetical protein